MAKKNKSSASVPKGQEPIMQPTEQTPPTDALNTQPLTTQESTVQEPTDANLATVKQNKLVMAPIKLRTHIIFEGEPKAPGDIVEIQAKDLANWVGAGLADAVEPDSK